jgi:hypothetical protein
VDTADSGKIIECTGSLLNRSDSDKINSISTGNTFTRRWIISAAHCFCGNAVMCPDTNLDFKKVFNDGDEGAERLKKIKLKFGTKDQVCSPWSIAKECPIPRPTCRWRVCRSW